MGHSLSVPLPLSPPISLSLSLSKKCGLLVWMMASWNFCKRCKFYNCIFCKIWENVTTLPNNYNTLSPTHFLLSTLSNLWPFFISERSRSLVYRILVYVLVVLLFPPFSRCCIVSAAEKNKHFAAKKKRGKNIYFFFRTALHLHAALFTVIVSLKEFIIEREINSKGHLWRKTHVLARKSWQVMGYSVI